MKNKLVKILSVVFLVSVLVGCFVFSSSAEEVALNDSLTEYDVLNKYFLLPNSMTTSFKEFIRQEAVNPSYEGSGDGNEGTALYQIDFVSCGIHFNSIKFDYHDGVASVIFGSKGLDVNVFSDNGYVNEFRYFLVTDFSEYGLYGALPEFFGFLHRGYLREMPTISSPIHSSYVFAGRNWHDIVRGFYLAFGLDTYHVIQEDGSHFYNFIFDNGDGNIVTPDYNGAVHGIRFHYNPNVSGGTPYSLAFLDSSAREIIRFSGPDIDNTYFTEVKISIPQYYVNWIYDLFSLGCDYVLYNYPYFAIANYPGISYIDFFNPGNIMGQSVEIPFRYMDFTDTYDGYSLPSLSSLNFDSYGRLIDSNGSIIQNTYLIHNNYNFDSSVVDSATYYLFNRACQSGYTWGGISPSRTLEYRFTSSDIIYYSPLNSFAPGQIYASGCRIVGALNGTYDYCYIFNGTIFFYDNPDADTSEYIASVSVADLFNSYITFDSGSNVHPSFYQFIVMNSLFINPGVAGPDGEGDFTYEEVYNRGYNAGLEEGKLQGESLGYNRGYDVGYNKGFSAGLSAGGDGSHIISSLLSAPGEAFDSLVLYESEGISVSIWDVFTTLLCASLFIWFLKMFAGG